jgi:hypothetical protein
MAKPEAIKQIIQELNPNAIFIKGFDKAIFGTGKIIGGHTVAVYNADDCLDILISDHEMGEIEAWEHFNETVAKGEPNPHKPIFVSDWRWAVDTEQILKNIKLDKQQTLDDILDKYKKNTKESEEESD